MRKGAGAALGSQEWGSCMMPSRHSTKHTVRLPGCPKRRFLWCGFCPVLWLPLSLRQQCNQVESFSLKALIKTTYWFRSQTTGATLNLLCSLMRDPAYRGAHGRNNITANPGSKYAKGGPYSSLKSSKCLRYCESKSPPKLGWTFPKVST